MSQRAIVILAGLLLPLSGCVAAAVGTAGAIGVSAAQERSMGEAVDDAATSSEIKARLLSEDGLAEVDVEVVRGLVLLTGRVNSPAKRTQAEDIAWSSLRTLDVANELNIERPGGFIANVSDEVITARVRSRMVGSSTVKSINFNIETYDGVVYLMGIARSQEELVAAAEEAARVGGVKQVVSYVRVRNPAARRAPTSYQGDPADAYSAEQAADSDLLGGDY